LISRQTFVSFFVRRLTTVSDIADDYRYTDISIS